MELGGRRHRKGGTYPVILGFASLNGGLGAGLQVGAVHGTQRAACASSRSFPCCVAWRSSPRPVSTVASRASGA
ncbi:hypothetical protein A176_000789 [Myxococcus hansupus]|uniref:Uncharacterized protein n=1 Tax=Pseudomyxococcus hansupus TaxID=1297742 RepID=A0A0H4X7M1_9BACT|nr:hypothetical protein A176_000789 [Myxococcus hansupus]